MKPLKVRNGIPFYYDKSEDEFKLDVYEQYDTTVLKNVRRYITGNSSIESTDYLQRWITQCGVSPVIVDNGCGIGFHAAQIAIQQKDALIFGFDYSYQMLSMAKDLWLLKKPSTLNLLRNYFSQYGLVLDEGVLKPVVDLQLALAKCQQLPLENCMIDVSYSCYLWDRITSQREYIIEQHRILRAGGFFIIQGPMSFTDTTGWNAWVPLEKLVLEVENIGFELIDRQSWEEKDVFDGKGNHIAWQVEAFCFRKLP